MAKKGDGQQFMSGGTKVTVNSANDREAGPGGYYVSTQHPTQPGENKKDNKITVVYDKDGNYVKHKPN